jgi:ankyrin repeat protein
VSTAAWENRADILDLLIAHGADVDKALDHTRPVLNELIRWGQFANARLCLARGASPNRPDDRGWTAMHQVVVARQSEDAARPA